jgi:adenylate cyclase
MHRQIAGVVLGLTIGLLGVVVQRTPWGLALEQSSGLYWLFHLRGTVRAPDDVVVVAIDKPSSDKLGLSVKPSEWPRNTHARLLAELTRAGAEVVVFDLSFVTPSPTPEHDQELAAAIRSAGNVVLVEPLHREVRDNIWIETTSPPIPILAEAARAHAPFTLPKASRVDTYWTFKESAGDAPTLPVVALHVYAQQVHDTLVKAWARAQQFPALPDRATLATPENLNAFIHQLRRSLEGHPELRERISQQLQYSRERTGDSKAERIVDALLSLHTGEDERYLNLYGPPRTIKTVPYHEVLERASSSAGSGDFKGKAVFVGFSAAGPEEQDRIRDDYDTVFWRSDGLGLSGVEIGATALANLLEDRSLRPLPIAASLAFLLLWGVGLGVLLVNLRPTLALGLVLLLAASYLFFAVYRFKDAALWLPVVIPLCVQAPLAYLGALGYRYRSVRREREAIRSAFGYFLPAAVVDRLAAGIGPITADNHLVYGTFLATDLEQYTTLAEKMAPEPLARLMNDYYGALFPPVESREGIISDVVGDAMLALWASASPNAGKRREACLAALQIAKAATPFASSADTPLRTRIGLHSGDVMLGSVGAAHHYEYRAVGDIVNTATRIQGLNKILGTTTLASDAVLEGVDGLLTRPLGSFVLAGKTTAVKVSELIATVDQASEAQCVLAGRFAIALKLIHALDWCGAAAEFADLLADFPDDGPTQFYLARSKQFVAAPPGQPWGAAIQIDTK